MKPPPDHQEQAALLARWLEEHPGSPAPGGLDPEVLETVYALRPDLAPAPSFSIDDILAGVTCGPFAATAGASEDEPPTEEIEAEEASRPPALAPVVELSPPRSPRRAWLWPATGALAVAAMALIVVTPYLKHGVPRLGSPEPAMTAAPSLDADLIAEIAPAPEAPRARDSATQRPPAAEATVPPAQRAPAASADGAEESFYGEGLTRAGAGGGVASTTVSSSGTPMGPEARREAEIQSGEAERGGLGMTRPDAAPTTPAPAEPMGGWAGAGPARSPATVPSATPAAPPADQPEPSTAASGAAFSGPPSYDLALDDLVASDDFDEEAEPEDLAQGEVSVAESAGSRANRDERKRIEEDLDDRIASRDASGREAASKAGIRMREPRAQNSSTGAVSRHATEEAEAPPPAAPAAAQAAPAPEPVLSELDDDGADALRSQANPLDYRGDWYLREPSLDPATRAAVAAAFAKAQSAIVAGDVAGAVAALSPLLASPHPMVAQDAAFRLATLQLQSGQIEMASATVRRGLAASGSPTVFRSRLLALQGSILEERGRPVEAVDSYREAVEDNDARH